MVGVVLGLLGLAPHGPPSLAAGAVSAAVDGVARRAVSVGMARRDSRGACSDGQERTAAHSAANAAEARVARIGHPLLMKPAVRRRTRAGDHSPL